MLFVHWKRFLRLHSCLSKANFKQDEGGMALNQRLVVHLLSKLPSFNEWGQCTILQVLEKYIPTDEEELVGILVLYFSVPNKG